MDTNCAPMVADIFLFYYERDFIMYLSDDNQANDIDAFNTTSRYLNEILNINKVYFGQYGKSTVPFRLQLNKANTSDTKAVVLTCNC